MVKQIRAFTLMEIMIVIVIVGLMAAFALPNYGKAIAKADERNAINNLLVIRSAVEMYLANTGDATIPNMANIDAINATLGLSITDPNTTYECQSVDAGELNKCWARHPNGWFLHFHDEFENIHCSATGGACPDCDLSPTGCGF